MDTTSLDSQELLALPAYNVDCPSLTVVDVLANKWVLYVLGLLQGTDRPLRFGELKRSVEGVTQKSLTKTLRALERDGLIDRRVYATVPPKVEYRLTDLGREAGHLLAAIESWAKDNADKIAATRAGFDAHSVQNGSTASAWTQRG